MREMTEFDKVHRRRRHFVQRAVHAVADLEFVLEGLEVNVGGLLLDRLVEHEIDEADDRGAVGLGLEAWRGHLPWRRRRPAG